MVGGWGLGVVWGGVVEGVALRGGVVFGGGRHGRDGEFLERGGGAVMVVDSSVCYGEVQVVDETSVRQ